MRTINWRSGLYLSGVLALAGAPVAAESGKFTPSLTGELSIEIESDFVYKADDPDAELNDLYATIEPSFHLGLTEALSVNLGLTLEPVQDPEPGEDREFDDHGVYVADITINYDTDSYSVYLGKFTPNFGIAWDVAPGMYGADLAEDYELAERLGLGGAVRFNGAAAGTLQISASAFFADTSFLNESTITDRGHLQKSDGGLSNTEDLSSYTIALDGNDVPGLEGFHYHLGFSHQASGVGGGSDENAFAIGLEYAVEVSPGLEIAPMLEYARLNDAGGVAGDDTGYLTAGVGATYGPWNMAIAYAGRDTDTATSEDSVVQVSAGYAFDFGLGVDVGWRLGDEGGEDSETVGILLTYGYEF